MFMFLQQTSSAVIEGSFDEALGNNTLTGSQI